MKVRSDNLMSRKAALLGGALLMAMVPATAALAADQLPVKAAPIEDMSGWYSYGTLEAGSNFFIQKPGSGFGKSATDPFWLTPNTTDSNAKMDEYGKVPRGLFLKELGIHAGTKDGRFAFDFWADNVGMDNQRYYLGIYEPGRQYFNMGWDQTPHLLSSSAKTIFSGVGSARLTVDSVSRDFLQSHLGQTAGGTGTGTPNSGQKVADRTCIDDFINGRNTLGAGCATTGSNGVGPFGQLIPGAAPMTNIELKTLREKFNVGYRNTMLDNWDFNVDYSHEHRTGTRPLGIGWGYAFWNGVNNAVGATGQVIAVPRSSSGSIEVPQPLDDRTQNLNGAGEYSGTTPWGTQWNTSVKYAGSFYNNSIKSIDVDNPFCRTCVAFTGVPIAAGVAVGPNLLRYGLYPDNNANGVTWSTAVNFPIWKTRYVSTLQYTSYRQNDDFINTSTNGVTVPAYPATGLTGGVDAFLSNNVLTSQITHDLSNVARVRYYDRKDSTPTLTFNTYNWADAGLASAAEQVPVTRMPHSYSKLNLEDQLKWQINRTWAVGGGPVFERFVFQNGEVDSTNEGGAKAYVNMTARLATWRSSVEYTQRRYNTYLATSATDPAANAMRYFFVANRNRTKGNTVVELAAFKNVTISPNGGFRWDEYPADQTLTLITSGTSLPTLGTKYDRSWNIGTDVNVRVTPELRVTFGYNHEEHYLRMQSCCGGSSTLPLSGTSVPYNDADKWASNITQRYNTYMASALWNAIPGKLDFKANYVAAVSNEANQTTICTSGLGGCTGAGTGVTIGQVQFPDEHNIFQRFSVVAKYYVDPSVVKQMGWFGQVTANLRYTWERNRNTNWATDNFSPYSPSAADSGGDTTNGGRSLFLAYDNPNYTAQIITASIGWKW
jgi:MtrB/PioB family decaheme-associated outer membrane protein